MPELSDITNAKTPTGDPINPDNILKYVSGTVMFAAALAGGARGFQILRSFVGADDLDVPVAGDL